MPVVTEMTLGRAPGSTLELDDPTVSRAHARIGPAPTAAPTARGRRVQRRDVPRRRPLTRPRAAARRRADPPRRRPIGVERRRDASEAGRTIVVPAGAAMTAAAQLGARPRVRSGYALKRLEAAEGPERFVLRDLRPDKFLRLTERDARLFERLDGQHSLVELISFAEQQFGADRLGAGRAAARRPRRARLPGRRERGEARRRGAAAAAPRLVGPRVKAFAGSARVRALYERGGWVLFLRPVLVALARARGGGDRRVHLPRAGRYGTPFVVANKIGLGGARLPRRALRVRGRARGRARADDGVATAGRSSAPGSRRAYLPVRVRGHVGGVVRAAPAPDRVSAAGPGVGLHARRRCSRSLRVASTGRCARSSSSSRSRPTSARCSTSTRSWTATATTSSSTCCASRG